MLKIKFKKIREDAEMPKRATDWSVGFDLCAFWDEKDKNKEATSVVIGRGETVKIGTGIAIGWLESVTQIGGKDMYLPYGAFVFARSGLATRQGLAPANKVGVIDMDYRGEIIVALHNHSNENQTISRGDRIAQLVFMPVILPEFIESASLDETDRGEGGFGSTGR